MKRSLLWDSRMLAVLKLAESGVPVWELCREQGMSSASLKWRPTPSASIPRILLLADE